MAAETDPIHDYILKADTEDLKEMLEAEGLDMKTEVAWVEEIIQKHLKQNPGQSTDNIPYVNI